MVHSAFDSNKSSEEKENQFIKSSRRHQIMEKNSHAHSHIYYTYNTQPQKLWQNVLELTKKRQLFASWLTWKVDNFFRESTIFLSSFSKEQRRTDRNDEQILSEYRNITLKRECVIWCKFRLTVFYRGIFFYHRVLAYLGC